MVFKEELYQTDFVMHATGQNCKHERRPCIQVYDNQLNQLKMKKTNEEEEYTLFLLFCME